MKKKSIIVCFIILIIIGVFTWTILNKNKEAYITDNEFLYDLAIDYLNEEEYQSNNPDSDKNNYHFFFDYDGLGITEKDEYKYVYMWVLGESYYLENDELKASSSYSMFFKFTFENDKVVKYENPKDGSEYPISIKKMCIDNKMSNKIINYDSKLSNDKKIEEYYSKVTNADNLKKDDITSNDGLLFTIDWKQTDCIPISLAIYDNNKYVLYTSYEACKPDEFCNSMLNYNKEKTGTYDYDVMKIIKNSVIADNMTFTNETLPEYEIYTGNGEFVYMLTTDSNNNYLNEFLNQININLHTCAEPDYK